MKKIGNPVFHSGKEFAQFWWCGELEGEGGGCKPVGSSSGVLKGFLAKLGG